MDFLIIFVVFGIALLIVSGNIQPTPPEYVLVPIYTQPAPRRMGCFPVIAILVVCVIALLLIRSQAAIPAW